MQEEPRETGARQASFSKPPEVPGLSWQKMRTSVSFKLFSMLGLLMVAMIPVAFIRGLVSERQQLQHQAIDEVNQKWAGQQSLAGPALTLPYRHSFTNDKKQTFTVTEYLHMLPAQLEISGRMLPETLHRGIYDMIVYTSDLELKGYFEAEQFKNLPVGAESLLWNQAFVSLGIPDLRGIKESVKLNWAGHNSSFDPGAVTDHLYAAGIHTPVRLDAATRGKRIPFTLKLALKGNQQLYFLPVGKETRIHLSAPWPDPSFDGAFLPDTRKVDANGFEASWQVLHLNRNFPQLWVGKQYSFEGSAFGVHLIQPVDHYLKVERSVKYALFFIGLTFLTFFFVEVLTRRMVHPLQYLLVGFALCVFYTLLLSISEQLGFEMAYGISAVMTIGLVTAYSAGFLRSLPLTAVTSGVLVSLYGFIYVILNQQDYALLMGSLGLFAVLALVMFFSRHLDLGQGELPARA
ncbi:MAG: cell envelope integrity protein CreD [Candidatus Sericytochromatia bacterium]